MTAEDQRLPLGLYEHFTGNRYRVTGFGHLVSGNGTDEVVGEPVVVYHATFTSASYGENAIWVRSVDNFVEEVPVDGGTVPRFRLVEPEGTSPTTAGSSATS